MRSGRSSEAICERSARASDGVDLVVACAEAVGEAREHSARDRARDLEAHDVAEAAAPQLELDCLEQVVGLVRDLEVRVTRHAEDGALHDLHLREQAREEVRDHGLEWSERAPLPDLQEARETFRHLHAREALLPGLRVADEHGEAVREARDVREGLPRADREGRQHRVDLAVEAPLELGALLFRALVHLRDRDARLGQLRHEVPAPEARLAGGEREDAVPDFGERRGRRATVRREHRDAGGLEAHEPGDADHEELVEVRGEDRAELDALEQRHRRVLCELEHAGVEIEPGELAIEESLAFLGDLGRCPHS